MGRKHSMIEQSAHLPLIPSKHIISGIVFNGPCILKGLTIKTNKSDTLEAELFDGNPGTHAGYAAAVGSDVFGGLMHGGDFVRIEDHLRVVLTGTVGDGFVTVYFNNYDASPGD